MERQWTLGENERRKRYQEHALGEALMALSEIGLPAIIRPSFTMGGTGGGIAYNKEEFSTSSSAASTPPRPTRC